MCVYVWVWGGGVGVYYEHDSKIIPGKRYKDVRRDTLVIISLLGQWKL